MMRPTDSETQSPLERALGLEIQAEAKRQGKTHKFIQGETGIPGRSWRRWFVSGDRHIPLEEAEKVAKLLGVSMSVLLARAERGVSLLSAAADDLAGATPAEMEDLRRAIDRARPGRIRKTQTATETESNDG